MVARFKVLKVNKAYQLRFSPDGRYAAAIGRNVVLWDIHARNRAASAHPVKHPAYLDFSLDGTRLAVKSTAGEVRVLNVPDLRIGNPLGGETLEGCQLLFSACGRYLIDGSWNGNVYVRESDSGNVVFSQSHPHAMITGLSASADRSLFAYVIQPKALDRNSPPGPSKIALQRWPFSDHVASIVEEGLERVWALALDPTGSLLAAFQQIGSVEFRLEVYSLDPFKRVSSRHTSWGGTNMAIAWSPDGKFIGCVEDDKISFYDTHTVDSVNSVQMPSPCFVEFSTDGSTTALGSWEDSRIVGAESILSPQVLQ